MKKSIYPDWIKKIDNQILLFNIVLLSLPLFLFNMCTLQTAIIMFAIWCFGITISIIFWRIRNIDNKTPVKKYN